MPPAIVSDPEWIDKSMDLEPYVRRPGYNEERSAKIMTLARNTGETATKYDRKRDPMAYFLVGSMETPLEFERYFWFKQHEFDLGKYNRTIVKIVREYLDVWGEMPGDAIAIIGGAGVRWYDTLDNERQFTFRVRRAIPEL